MKQLIEKIVNGASNFVNLEADRKESKISYYLLAFLLGWTGIAQKRVGQEAVSKFLLWSYLIPIMIMNGWVGLEYRWSDDELTVYGLMVLPWLATVIYSLIKGSKWVDEHNAKVDDKVEGAE